MKKINRPFLKNEFLKIFENFLNMKLFTHIYDQTDE